MLPLEEERGGEGVQVDKGEGEEGQGEEGGEGGGKGRWGEKRGREKETEKVERGRREEILVISKIIL